MITKVSPRPSAPARSRPAPWLLAALLVLAPAARGAGASATEQAMALARAGKTDAAIGRLEKVLAGSPHDVVARNNLAVLYAQRGDLERARALLVEAINSDPRYALVYRNLTDIYDRFAAVAYDRALFGEDPPAKTPLHLVMLEPGSAAPAATAVASTHAPAAPAVTAPAPVAPAAVVATAAVHDVAGSSGAQEADGKTRPAPPVAKPPAARPATDGSPAAKPPVAELAVAKPAVPKPARAKAPAPPAPAPPPPAVRLAAVRAPAAAPSAPASGASAREAVLGVVRGWAAAWSAKDVTRYLGFYDRRFTPAGGMSHAAWVAQRHARLAKPKFIEVKVGDPKVSFPKPDRAEVRFRQTYRNNAFTSRVAKVLTLVRDGGSWKIAREVVIH